MILPWLEMFIIAICEHDFFTGKIHNFSFSCKVNNVLLAAHTCSSIGTCVVHSIILAVNITSGKQFMSFSPLPNSNYIY
jgi:hypothetical protein